jgi:Zn-dependent peptidase ImmA (M78 family)
MRQLEWLSPSDIKDKVCALLQRYNQKFDLDKPTNLNLPANTLGSISENGKIFINEELMTRKFSEGRYRFTVAHEIGHWLLHQAVLQGNKKLTASLFRKEAIINNQEGTQTILCRKGDKNPGEWQANKFAALLLMPPQLVLPLYRKLQEKYEEDLGSEIQKKIIFKMADRFNTSLEATRIHLKELNLKPGQLTLF